MPNQRQSHPPSTELGENQIPQTRHPEAPHSQNAYRRTSQNPQVNCRKNKVPSVYDQPSQGGRSAGQMPETTLQSPKGRTQTGRQTYRNFSKRANMERTRHDQIRCGTGQWTLEQNNGTLQRRKTHDGARYGSQTTKNCQLEDPRMGRGIWSNAQVLILPSWQDTPPLQSDTRWHSTHGTLDDGR